MGCWRVAVLSCVVLVLSVVGAREDGFESEEGGASVRARREAGEVGLRGGAAEAREAVRLRRDEEAARHRRQGGHGGGGGGGHEGITGPVHTFVKTDEHAHFKWGVRHHVGHEYAGRR